MEQSINKHIKHKYIYIYIICICIGIKPYINTSMNKSETHECILILIILIKCQVPSTLHTQLLEISRCTDVAKEKWAMEWAMGSCYNSASAMVTPMLFSQTNANIYIYILYTYKLIQIQLL